MRRSICHCLIVAVLAGIPLINAPGVGAQEGSTGPDGSDTGAFAEGTEFEATIGIRDGATTPKVQPVGAPAGNPRDAEGNEYTCTSEVITDENIINTFFGMYPGGSEGKPMPEGGTMQRTDCTYVDPALADRVVQDADQGYRYVPPPGEVDLEGWLLNLRAVLVPDEVRIRTWPSEQFVVGIPTRFRVENFDSFTSPELRTPNVWAQATATPTHVLWRFGDKVVRCDFAGKPFEGDDDDAPDACMNTFHRRTDGWQQATVTVYYEVTWVSNLRDGVQRLDAPIESPTLSFTYGVRGYQAVIR